MHFNGTLSLSRCLHLGGRKMLDRNCPRKAGPESQVETYCAVCDQPKVALVPTHSQTEQDDMIDIVDVVNELFVLEVLESLTS